MKTLLTSVLATTAIAGAILASPAAASAVEAKHASIHLTRTCTNVEFKSITGVAEVQRTIYPHGRFIYFARAKDGYLFNNGEQFLVRHVHVKRHGC